MKEKAQKKLGYTVSAIDYFGLVSWILISRTSNTILKAGNSFAKNILEPFNTVKRKSNKKKVGLSKSNIQDQSNIQNQEKILKLESTISKLEKRLSFLEQHGVTLSGKTEYKTEKKEINNEKKALLRMLVEENRQLKKTIE